MVMENGKWDGDVRDVPKNEIDKVVLNPPGIDLVLSLIS